MAKVTIGGLAWLVAIGFSGVAWGGPLMAPSGFEGAGLGKTSQQRGRAWGEIGYHTQDRITIVAPTFGVGLLPVPQLELEAIFPFSHARGDNDSETTFGNLYLGANYLSLDGEDRVKVGLGMFLATAPTGNGSEVATNIYGTYPEGLQHFWLHIPYGYGVVAPVHLEGGRRIFGSLDAAGIVVIPSADAPDSADTEMYATFAPGVGMRAIASTSLGVRVPMFWAITADSGDDFQITVEPYLRFDFGSGFFSVRFNIPVDDPLKKESIWGLLLGAGGAF